MDLVLTSGQEEALKMVGSFLAQDREAFALLTGFAGSGKTTICRVLSDTYGRPVILTPTGKAALRVGEATGLSASTIHSFLYSAEDDPLTGEPVFSLKSLWEIGDAVKGTFVLIDEASMVGEEVWNDLIGMAAKVGFKILLMGDRFQLPPVNKAKDGREFSTLSLQTPFSVNMTEIVRQALDSPIIRASMELRSGKPIYEAMKLLTPVAQSKTIETLLRIRQTGGVTLVHRNITRHSLNNKAREALGYENGSVIVGEPLLVLQNNQKIGRYNGEILTLNGWEVEPSDETKDVVRDNYTNTSMNLTYGVADLEGSRCMLSPEEICGRTETSKIGQWSIRKSSKRTYKNKLATHDEDHAPTHVHANYGYALTTHKCVHPDTVVETPDGLMRISELRDRGVIATPSGAREYINLVRNPPTEMLRISTKGGYEVTVTPDHGLYSWNGSEYERKEAQDLGVGDWLRVALGPTCESSVAPQLPPPPADCDIRTVVYKLPAHMTDELAELLGIIVADGTVTKRRCGMAKRHKEVVDRFVHLCMKVFGIECKRFDKPATGATSKGHVYWADMYSTYITTWLKTIGGLQPNAKGVPDVILKATMRQQALFLKGLFEDGSVGLKNGAFGEISWSTSHPEMAKLVQIMLLRFDIVSTRTRVQNQFTLYIYAENAYRFAQQIGFITIEKTRRVGKAPATGFKFVSPVSRAEIDRWEPFLSANERNNARIRKTMSRTKLRSIARRTQDEGLEERLLWQDLRVEKVEAVPDAESWCVEVPEGNRFLQNGFDGSNSQGSEYPEVLVVMEGSINAMPSQEQKRFLYTAITRGKKQVYYVQLKGDLR